MTKAPNILDLDALVQEPMDIILNEKTHRLRHVTLKDFLENAKDVEALGKSPSLREEIDITKRMLGRAFPTMKDEDFDGLTMQQMQAVVDFAHANNGQADGAVTATGEAKANPPPAA